MTLVSLCVDHFSCSSMLLSFQNPLNGVLYELFGIPLNTSAIARNIQALPQRM